MSIDRIKRYRIFVYLGILVVVFVLGMDVANAQDFGTGYLAGADLPSDDVRVVIVRIINYILSALGVLFLGLVIYGGFLWMTAGGNTDQVSRAKKIIINAVTGLVIIFFSFAITRFIFNLLTGASNVQVGDKCQEGSVSGCSVCLGGRWLFDPSICPLPGSEFAVKEIGTANEGGDPSQNVYLCSSIQTQFNNSLDKDTVGGNIYLVEEGQAVGTDLYTGRRVVELKPQDNLKPNTTYTMQYSKSILDRSGLSLSACYPFGCSDNGSEFIWSFQTGTQTDSVSPLVVSTYPLSDVTDPKYPARNISRDSIIKAEFSEAVRSLSIEDGTGRPIASNIIVQEIDGEGGNVVSTLPAADFEVITSSQGFTLRMIPPNLYKPFTWYRVTIQNVEDLCGNPMEEPYVFEFQTNDRVPGVGNFYPEGDNICPDTEIITFTFNTSMYNDFVSITVSEGSPSSPPVFSAGIKPYQMDPGPYRTTGQGGIFYTDSTSNFKVFTFEPSTPLTPNTVYYVNINTDRVIDVDGNTLQYSWQFTVSTQDKCICSPYISSINPSEGLLGQCVTIEGYCFQGAVPDDSEDPRNAQVTSLEFNDVPAVIGSYSNRYITTSIPMAFEKGEYLLPQISISYNDSNIGTLRSKNKNVDYFVSSDKEAEGPCLLSITPSRSCFGTEIRLEGMRFGDDPGEGSRATDDDNVTFADGNARVPDQDVTSWKQEEIKVKVPQGAYDGGVYVTAGGLVSNSIPYDISCRVGQNCNISPSEDACVDGGICGEGLICDPEAACTCQYETPPGAPRMIYNPSCAEDEIQTPTPYPNMDGICVNALISAQFNMNMDESTFNSKNIKVFECGNSRVFSDENCSDSALDGAFDVINRDTDNEGFVFTPSANLKPSTWYKVFVGKGIKSFKGVSTTRDYIWKFRTKANAQECSLKEVRVAPHRATIFGIGRKRVLSALPQAENCQIINPDKFSWEWNSENDLVAIVANVDKSTSTVTSVSGGRATITAETLNIVGRSIIDVATSTDPTLCVTDADCTTGDNACPGSRCDLDKGRCTPVIKDVSPMDGAPGNWITISGCMFGNGGGSVNFIGDIQNRDDDREGIIPSGICSRPWTNTQIIVEVPDASTKDTSDDAVDGPIEVVTFYGLRDSTIQSFDVNNNIYPGLCEINPSQGTVNQQVSLVGNNFGDVKTDSNDVIFSSVVYSPALASGEIVAKDIVKWSNNNIVLQVPARYDDEGNLIERAGSGDVYVQLLDEVSNPVYFDMNPFIERITPSYGPEGKFITIVGGNFGYKPGRVIFTGDRNICQGGDKDGQVCQTNSDCIGENASGVCINDPSDDIEAPLPTDICGDVWSDSMIIAKVPQGARTGLVKVETSADYTPSGALITRDRDSGVFVVDNTYPYGANLCRLDPNSGKQGDKIDIFGERMGTEQGTSKVDFYHTALDKSETAQTDTWSDDRVKVTVPLFDIFTSTTTAYVTVLKQEVVGQKCTGVVIRGECVGGQWEDVLEYIPSNSLPYYIKPGLGPSYILGIKSINPKADADNVCRNVAVEINFDKVIRRGTVNPDTAYIEYEMTYGKDEPVPAQCKKVNNDDNEEDDQQTGWLRKGIDNIVNAVRGVFAQTPAVEEYVCRVPVDYTLIDNRPECSIGSVCTDDKGCACYSDYPVNKDKVCVVKEGKKSCLGEAVDTTVLLSPLSALDTQKTYTLNIKGTEQGVRSVEGGFMRNDYQSSFTTGDIVCQISKVDVTINPPGTIGDEDIFTCSLRDDCPDDQDSSLTGNQHVWTAVAKDEDDNVLQASYEWKLLGSSRILNLNPLDANQTKATPQGINGRVLSRVQAEDSTGLDAGSAVEVISTDVFICENPWPDYNNFPYKDEDMGFSLAFCRDRGEKYVCFENGVSTGKSCIENSDCSKGQVCQLNAQDDLPALTVVTRENPAPDITPIILKEYLFLPDVPSSDDAIAIRVYANDKYLSLREWYDANVPNPGNPRKIIIDGYEALQDGRTVYVSAAVNKGDEYQNYIFVMSYNKNADDSIKDIYNEFLNNWKFTIDLNDKYVCSEDQTISCTQDSDCAELNAGVCMMDAQKIRRDLIRVQDLTRIRNVLNDYYNKNNDYPTLQSGTFKAGFTTSKWGSWQSALGTVLGTSLPVDPLNVFNGCPDGYNPDTCWNGSASQFVCPDGSYIYQYSYIDSNDVSKKTSSLYANFELNGINWAGFGSSGNSDACNSVTINIQNGE